LHDRAAVTGDDTSGQVQTSVPGWIAQGRPARPGDSVGSLVLSQQLRQPLV